MNKVFLKKIIAQNSKDLQIISACCSGSKIHIQDIKYLKENKLFLISLERFAKETEDESIKIQSILKFEFIDKSRSKNIDINNSDITLELLGIDLYKKENNYEITLLFLDNAILPVT